MTQVTRTAAPLVSPSDAAVGKDLSVIEVRAQAKPITKAERTFQRLVAQIDRKRDQLAKWREYAQSYNERAASEMGPLRVQLRGNQRELAMLIDRLVSDPAPGRRLGRVQRVKLEQLLLNLLATMLREVDDKELEALHDKYSDVSHQDLRKFDLDRASASADDDETDVDDKIVPRQTDGEQTYPSEPVDPAEQARDARDAARADRAAAKETAAQARREQASKEVAQSVRAVYRKLVSVLHPDRERDTEARKRKTLLMQQVNQAYRANDLLTLLSLQLKLEQIDVAHLSAVPPQRLTHYNQVLREQLAGLDAELERCVRPFLRRVGGSYARLTPAAVDKHLNANVRLMRLSIQKTRKDLIAFRDHELLRGILKRITAQGTSVDQDDAMDGAQASAPPPRGRKRGKS